MTATQVLCVARAANIAIRVDGDDLILEASAPLAMVLREIRVALEAGDIERRIEALEASGAKG